jgi:superfamily II DNA or RNA helicase
LLCRWYLRNAPEYRGRFREIWLWKDWPEAWAADAGIDLVAQEIGGALWAVQAKAYGEDYAIRKADVDSFLSESNRPHFSYRLLIATTDRIGPTARRTLDGQTVPVGYLLRSQLELAEVQWPVSFDKLRTRPPKPKKPFPHVRDAIRATVAGFDRAERGQLIMACGTGKTLAGLWTSERLRSIRTLVLVPSLSLLAQTLREWTANATQPFDYLAVCSDETVLGEDEFVAHTAELAVPVTTDPGEISSFLRRRGRRVVFSTYQSSGQIAAAQRRRTPQFDLAIADEAHRCAGRVASEFATVLDPALIKSRRRLFMTATPRFYTPRLRHEAGQLDVEIASMDNEAEFGKVFHRLSFGEAIKRNLLSDYQVVVVGVTDGIYRSFAERGEPVTRDRTRITDARTLAGQIGLAKAMRKWDLRRVVSFHGRVNAARRFSAEMPDVIAWMPSRVRPKGALWSEHVSGVMPTGQRDRLLLRFRNLFPRERGLLSNARCLAEGVDVPSIDGVAFIDPRYSTIDIIQAVGRAIRKAPDKKVGTIVLPVFLSTDADAKQTLDDSSFRHVWDVLKALRAHDDALGEELDELRRQLGASRKRIHRPAKIHLDVPISVGKRFARAFDARLIEATTTSWEFWFGLLQQYAEREGHARVPGTYCEDDLKLGLWVANQRTRAHRLTPERRRRLTELPGWTWNPHDAAWEDAFALLVRYVERDGQAGVPDDHQERGFGLGGWVSSQRAAFRRGVIDSTRAQRLAALPGWIWDPQEEAWEEALKHLRRFVKREGHARVPQNHIEDGFPLGPWVATVRGAFRRKSLEPRRAEQLAAFAGWVWNPYEASWEESYSRLLRFVEREGHARPSQRDLDKGFNLGGWVSRQRSAFAHGRLGPDRVKRLAALPGWVWDPKESAWEEALTRLLQFVEREGHARVPNNAREDGFSLGGWASVQRATFRAKKLPAERALRFTALSGWSWDPVETFWEEGFSHLVRFIEREGHARVPSGHRESGFRLAIWVSTQRSAYAKGTLDGDRAKRLAALRGWEWNPHEALWEEGFNALLRFVEREGHARVPAQYVEGRFALGRWAVRQRQDFATGKLRAERKDRLASLTGWAWTPHEAAWEQGFGLLLSYVAREGHALVPDKHWEDGFGLGAWVWRQRAAFRKGKLPLERARRLRSLSGWSWEARPRP